MSGDRCGCSVQLVLNVECSVELGFGFYWVRVSFFFSSDSRAELENRAFPLRYNKRNTGLIRDTPLRDSRKRTHPRVGVVSRSAERK